MGHTVRLLLAQWRSRHTVAPESLRDAAAAAATTSRAAAAELSGLAPAHPRPAAAGSTAATATATAAARPIQYAWYAPRRDATAADDEHSAAERKPAIPAVVVFPCGDDAAEMMTILLVLAGWILCCANSDAPCATFSKRALPPSSGPVYVDSFLIHATRDALYTFLSSAFYSLLRLVDIALILCICTCYILRSINKWNGKRLSSGAAQADVGR
ncbi:hypothetical protein K438DRAFT_555578 [Mycena galopus ATCC 62051]|nr:hypothetical protein K438DRAFT_555578 [Mycena galopus ATCC 62051]